MIDETLARTLCLWALNYLLLSTVFVSVAWCVCQSRHLNSDSLRDQLWKLALIAPVVFTSIHAAWQPSSLTWNLARYFEPEQVVSVSASAEKADAPILIAEPIDAILEQNKSEESIQELEVPAFSPFNSEPVPQAELAPSIAEAVEKMPEPPSSVEVVVPFAEPIIPVETNEVQPEPFIISEAANVQIPLPAVPPQNETIQHPKPPTYLPVSSFNYWSIMAKLLVVLLSFGTLRFVLQSFLIVRRMSRFKTVEAGMAKEILIDLQRRLHCRFQIELLESKQKIEPAAYGVWRKKIIIPANLTEQLSPAEIEALLAHEVAHLLRRDPLWARAFCLMRNCLWWQPLNFLALRKWRMAAELCCDSNAVAAGVDRLNLARCLTHVATWKLAASPTYGVGASTTTLGVRVERLVEAPLVQDSWSRGYRRSLRWALLLVLLPLMLRFAPRMSWEVAAAPNESVVVKSFAPLADDSDVASIVAQPIPVEIEFPGENQVYNAPVVPEQTERPISVEIQQLTTDLNYALELLSDQESDPEILAAVAAVQSKIQRLNRQAEQQELSSRASNDVPIDE